MVHRDEQADLEGFLTFVRQGGMLDIKVSARRHAVDVGAFDIPAMIVSFAVFTWGAYILGEMLALWAMHMQFGLFGVWPASAIGAVLTFVYRDRMRTSGSVGDE